MKIAADTNVVLRAILEDNSDQGVTARQSLDEADHVVFSIGTLCELVWVLRSRYRQSPAAVERTLRLLLDDPRAVFDAMPVATGLAFLAAGGDFADGAIAGDGRRLGAESFVTFDRKAARLLEAAGDPVILLD